MTQRTSAESTGRQKRRTKKDIVGGIRQRGGDLRLFKAESNSTAELAKHITKNVSTDVDMIVTDEWAAYPAAMIASGIHGTKHEAIRHKDRVYVRGEVHTNTIESALSLFKRGLTGSVHQISTKHLQRYLDEFSYRFNRRNDDGAFVETVPRLCGFDPLPFSVLTSE